LNILKNIIVFSLFSTFVFAHGNHKKKKGMMHKTDTLTIVAGDTIAINGISTAEYLGHKTKEPGKENVEEEEETEKVSLDALFEHVHNKLIHFPIAFGILLFIFMILGYKQEVCNRASKIIVVLGTLASIAAIITGYMQIAPFEGTATFALVQVHRILGFVVLGIYLIMNWAVFTRQSNKILLILSGILALTISLAGLYGGVIAH